MDDPDEASSEGARGTFRPKSERSIGALLSDLASQMGLLVRQETALLKAELSENLGRLGTGVAAIAVGGLVAFSGWLVLLAAAVLGLATVMALWLAALIVGLSVLAIGVVLLYFGRSRLDAEALLPRRSLNSLREDEAWLRERFR